MYISFPVIFFIMNALMLAGFQVGYYKLDPTARPTVGFLWLICAPIALNISYFLFHIVFGGK